MRRAHWRLRDEVFYREGRAAGLDRDVAVSGGRTIGPDGRSSSPVGNPTLIASRPEREVSACLPIACKSILQGVGHKLIDHQARRDCTINWHCYWLRLHLNCHFGPLGSKIAADRTEVIVKLQATRFVSKGKHIVC